MGIGSVLGSIGGSVLGKAAGGLAGDLIGGSLGHSDASRRNYKFYKRRDRYDWERAQERGLTPQEFYGSPAAGGSPGTMSATLGNNFSQKMQQESQLQFQQNENEKDRDRDIKVAELYTGTQKETAELSAETQRYIADNKLALDERKLTEVLLPEMEAKTNLQKKQLDIAVNQLVTSTPKFQREMKLLSMGVENTMQTALLRRFGLDPTQGDSVNKLSDEQFANFFRLLIASGSVANRELQGLLVNTQSLLDSLGNGDKTFNPGGPPGRPPGPLTPGQPPSRPNLGRRGHGARQ